MSTDTFENSAPLRRRVVEWSDPAEVTEAGRGLDGLAYLRALKAGTVPPPPLVALLGIELVSADHGRVTMRMMPEEFHYNPLGSVHGGAIASLLDSAMGCAVHSTLPQGHGYTTLEVKVNYLRAVTTASGPLTAVGEIVHVGRRQAVVEARLTDGEDRLCATAGTTCLFIVPSTADGASSEKPDPILEAWTSIA